MANIVHAEDFLWPATNELDLSGGIRVSAVGTDLAATAYNSFVRNPIALFEAIAARSRARLSSER
jgi:hypothetical protein